MSYDTLQKYYKLASRGLISSLRSYEIYNEKVVLFSETQLGCGECPREYGDFEYGGNCAKYCHCENGVAEERTCSVHNGQQTHFEAYTERCNYPESVVCSKSLIILHYNFDLNILDMYEDIMGRHLTSIAFLFSN